MITKKIFGFVLAITILLGCCSAKIYKVGGSNGWTAKKNSWATHKEFYVGDSLVFEYDQNVNDVTQVSDASKYESCDSSSPKAVYNTGHDVITFKEPGYHYFISSNHIQCVYGLKIDVLVVHDKSRPIPPPTPPSDILPFGKIYKVGGSGGWSGKKNSWAEHKEFHVGDSLVFEYDQNVNDVTQVFDALKYESCDSSSPKAVYNTGYDVVTLKEPGYHYFISSNHIQCVYGLKLDVLVVHDKSRPIPPPPPPSKIHEPSHPIPSPPPPSKIHEPSRPITPPPPPSKIHEPSRPIPPPLSPPSKVLPLGKIYKVGDSRGWSVYNSYYYYRWSEGKQFHVGDTLYFEYNKYLNDVREISDDLEFKSCEQNSTVAVYKTGHDLIKLTKPGVHYFVSLKTGLCQAGIKLRVTVQPLTEAVTLFPNVPKKKLSPIVNRWWLHPFRPHH
ncbi:unnamed protein product [Arabidopsis lyrata]|uniref:Phytocyanin domain-containing protein n=1 Tax=Arabidopsis lyrata subsp. lyrata TaxID=81972 RepID=D7LUH1_ARALL|nr:uncharacterized protein LOC9313981 [Arabidopsis lyrata subsp. lyrata]EFH52460.1 hypothetical protein ARALYDRAFT_906720 [Arabidopsis lyrata subsp. lyrata]CAH8268475.1 unnamed protein product [Arabidopsis lyrata]|eukprot:XP_002876201.1 uncharacterized protein LOC9313981 [Arabidopsis lyrata subsp. lyrata]